MTKGTVHYKYIKGQTLYYIRTRSIPTFTTCPTCDGEGFLVVPKSLKMVTCPTCEGHKTVSNSGSIKYVVFEGRVRKLEIDIDYAVALNYRMENDELETGSYHIVDEEELFEDRSEAEKQCAELNKTCLMGYTK